MRLLPLIITISLLFSCAANNVDNGDMAGGKDTAQTETEELGSRVERDWTYVGKATGTRIYDLYIDESTVFVNGDFMESWSKLKFQQEQEDTDGLLYKEVEIRSVIDCKRRTYSYMASKFYNMYGGLVFEEDNLPNNPAAITESTVSDYLADYLCNPDI